jgi:bifunctional UDP-N-acetylglucosamine pyrophosphorylase / glucosamine-1-phosphate N-acetyltransferase
VENNKLSAVTVLGMDVPAPSVYGKLVLDKAGTVARIVEAKDAKGKEKNLTLCNSGVMAIRAKLLSTLLGKLTCNNAAKEYYLTDLVGLARAAGEKCAVVRSDDTTELLGINSRAELAAAEAIMQNRLRARMMENGATLIDPATVYFSSDTVLGSDVTIHPHVVFGAGVKVGNNVEIRSFSHIDGAKIAKHAIIGPFARLRPGAVIGEGAHVGNFVEIKQSTLGKNAKANHLSYIGDSDVGEAANIGAGTITCNYDGFHKNRTVIGAGAFIGSNTSLVAPVIVGDGAVIGAGSVITEDVEAHALGLARPPQKQKAGWAKSNRNKKSH